MSPRAAPSLLRVLEPLDRRIPDWNMHRLISRRCPFCNGGGVPRFIRPDGLRVNHCVRCDSYFVSPAPDERQLSDFYASYFSRHRKEELRRHERDGLLVREMLNAEPAADEKIAVLAGLVDLRGKEALDVGFGLGQNMLLLGKLGAEVHGIDTDPDAVAFVRDCLHISTVRRCSLNDLPSTERYHLITLHDLVEHPLRPLEMLRRAVRHLEPGGLLSVWTPNATFAGNEVSPLQFRVDLEHMQYLSVRTASFLAAALNMHIIHLACTGTPRLQQIAFLSGEPPLAQRVRSVARRIISPIPGAIVLARLRRRLQPPRQPGTYHLFVIFRKPS